MQDIRKEAARHLLRDRTDVHARRSIAQRRNGHAHRHMLVAQRRKPVPRKTHAVLGRGAGRERRNVHAVRLRLGRERRRSPRRGVRREPRPHRRVHDARRHRRILDLPRLELVRDALVELVVTRVPDTRRPRATPARLARPRGFPPRLARRRLVVVRGRRAPPAGRLAPRRGRLAERRLPRGVRGANVERRRGARRLARLLLEAPPLVRARKLGVDRARVALLTQVLVGDARLRHAEARTVLPHKAAVALDRKAVVVVARADAADDAGLLVGRPVVARTVRVWRRGRGRRTHGVRRRRRRRARCVLHERAHPWRRRRQRRGAHIDAVRGRRGEWPAYICVRRLVHGNHTLAHAGSSGSGSGSLVCGWGADRRAWRARRDRPK